MDILRDEQKYQRAAKKVKRKRGFIIHSVIFLFGSIFLFLANITFLFPREPWFLAPVGIWFMIMVLHALYAFTGLLTKEWEEEQIDKELKKMGGHDYLEDEESLPLRELRRNHREADDDYV